MLKLTEAAKYFICNAIFGKPVTVIHYSFNTSTLKIGVIPLFNMPINFILKADQWIYMKKTSTFFLLFIIALFCLLHSNWYTDVMEVFNPLPAILTLATFRTQHHLSQEEILNKVGFNCFQVNTIQRFIFRSDNKIKPLFSISGIPLWWRWTRFTGRQLLGG